MAQKMEAAIEWRNMQGVKVTFSLDIDATKVAQVLEVSHTHGDIIGGEYPQRLIQIDGMDKIKFQELLYGKLEEYGKVSIDVLQPKTGFSISNLVCSKKPLLIRRNRTNSR